MRQPHGIREYPRFPQGMRENTLRSSYASGVFAMYQHLLVPIDGTDLSIETVGQAVEFARSTGARMTVLHVEPPATSSPYVTSVYARSYLTPDELMYPLQVSAREALIKAESAARAQGVPCASSSIISEAPGSEVLAIARKASCDLIFTSLLMTHGNGGMPVASQTLQILISAEIAVLVSSTAGNSSVAAQAIGLIRREYRSLTAILNAWLYLIKMAQWRASQPDTDLMQAMASYLKGFPTARRRTKKNQCLFRKLRDRATETTPELDELNRRHQRNGILVNDLADTLQCFIAGTVTLAEMERIVSDYAHFVWDHVGRQEGVIFPAARRRLTDRDWQDIYATLAETPGITLDKDTDFDFLWARIVGAAEAAGMQIRQPTKLTS